MRCSPTGSPAPIRSPSIDSLCTPDDAPLSLTTGQEDSPPSPPPPSAISDSLHEASVRDSTVLQTVSDRTSLMETTGTTAPIQLSKPLVSKMDFLRDKWLWETTCILFSIACIIAITILSSRLDGTWLSNWTFFLQPSTILSILVTAAQSSMMVAVSEVLSQLKWLQMSLPKAQSAARDFATFDSASRGPLGSLQLFYSWKPQSRMPPLMGYTASLITIAALAMGPFTQQVISIQADNLVPTDGMNSTIAVSNYYNHDPSTRGLQLSFAENGEILSSMTDARATEVDPDMEGSFYNGYYNLGKSFLDLNCPSSNCSWDVFNSLGVCSTCSDVTGTSQISETPGIAGLTIATFLTPGGWFIDRMEEYDKVVAITNDSFDPFTLDRFSANVVSMVVVQRGSHNPGQHYTVTECSIDWCAKQYSNVTVVNGTLQQHYSLREVPLWPVAGQDLGGLARGGMTFDNWIFMLTPDTDGRNISSPLPPFDHGGLNVSVYDFMSLPGLFVNEFNFSSESTTAAFGNGQNVTTTLTNITNSMTNSIMRSNSGSVALGVIWRQEPRIQVQWGWMALPLALVGFSSIVLASMIVASRHYNAPHWKSSPLPFLFHGSRNWNDEEEMELIEGQLEKVHVMEDRARSRRVQMIQSPKGGRWLI